MTRGAQPPFPQTSQIFWRGKGPADFLAWPSRNRRREARKTQRAQRGRAATQWATPRNTRKKRVGEKGPRITRITRIKASAAKPIREIRVIRGPSSSPKILRGWCTFSALALRRRRGRRATRRHPRRAKCNFAPNCVPKCNLGTRDISDTPAGVFFRFVCSVPGVLPPAILLHLSGMSQHRSFRPLAG